eukprot:s92_g56.t1
MAPSLRKLCKIVQLISAQEFVPDNTRSGRFRAEVQPTEMETATQVSDRDTEESYEMPFSEKLAGDTDDSGTDASSDAVADSENETLDATTLWDLVEPRHRPNLVLVKPGYETWMHVQSRVTHLRAEEAQRFACGRVASMRYMQVLQGASHACARCQTCYASKMVIAEAKVPVPGDEQP